MENGPQQPSGRKPSLGAEEKNWADVMAGIHRAAVERFNARRQLEWRLSLSLWGGLVVAANALREEDLEPGCNWKWIAVLSGAALAVILHAVWEFTYVSPSAKRDRDDGVKLDNALRALVNAEVAAQPGEYRRFVSHAWQVVVTGLLAVFLMVAITD